MAIVNGSLQEGYKDAAWFTANPTLVLKQGQRVNLEQTGTYKLGDGTTQLSALSFLGGSGTVDVNTIGAAINGASTATPNDTDLVMSVDTSVAKKNTWAQIKTFLTTYFETLFVKKGTLTANTIPKSTASDTISDSTISYDGSGNLMLGQSGKATTTGTTFPIYGGFGNSLETGYLGVSNDISLLGRILLKASGFTTITDDGSNGVIYSGLSGHTFNVGINVKALGVSSTGVVDIPQLTASQLIATDASKNLQSLDVATYPSLTELSYVKGVTSALQTQLNGKVNIADRKGADTYLKTGSTTFDLRYSTNATAFGATTNSVGKDAMIAMPFIIEETMTFDRIGAEVTSSVASGVCSLLIYDSVNNVPTNLVLDAGTISLTSATYQEITINKQLTAGLYFLVLWHNGATTPSFRAMPIAACNKVLGMPATLGNTSTYTRIFNTKVYTTAPSIYDTTGISVFAANNPIISLRRSA